MSSADDSRDILNDTEVQEWDREEFLKEVLGSMKLNLERLGVLWDRIGIAGQSLQDRYAQAVAHHQELTDQMYQEDCSLYNRLVATVDQNLETLKNLCMQLSLPCPEIEQGAPLVMKGLLTEQLQKVEEVKNERLDKLEELRGNEGDLCEVLEIEPFNFGHEQEIPTLDNLKDLEKQVEMLVAEKEHRYKKYVILCKDIFTLMNTVQREPENSLEHEIFSQLHMDNADNVKLPQRKLAAMKNLHEELKNEKNGATRKMEELTQKLLQLWNLLKLDQSHRESFLKNNGHCGRQALIAIEVEIQRCEGLRRANIGNLIEDLREEILDWWSKCQASEKQKNAFRVHLENGDYSEVLLTIHEKEAAYWRNLYQTFKSLYTNSQKMEYLFEKALELQQRSMDPKRFHNRGGQLLQEEKEKKRLLTLIPKLQTELVDLSRRYERTVGTPYQIGGLTLDEFLESKWALLQEDKENEKLQRKQRKEAAAVTPQKKPNMTVYSTPGQSTTCGGMRSMAFKSPARLATPGTARKQILRTPNGQVVQGQPASARKPPFPMNTPRAQRAQDSIPGTYGAFEWSLNKPGRSDNMRSTLTPGTKKVLGSKITPVYTNTGAKRKRFSNGRSPQLSRSRSRPQPQCPGNLSTSARGKQQKLTTTAIPFLY